MLIVQKYGGTSVGTIARMKRVARRCLETQKQGHNVAVVVSAMAGETNRLLALTRKIQEDPNDREVDVVIATGEQVSVGLVALAIRRLGGKAQSFLGHQVKITTDSAHSRARIRSIDAERISQCFREGKIAVIAGFQGMDEAGNITTLGRGGSDTTGVAIAAALKADVCEIYTDVDGVYTTDPNICPSARKIERTWVVPEEKTMEEVVVAGVSANRDEAKITLRGVPDQPGVAARIFQPLTEASIVVDMIIQNVSEAGHTDLTFTVPKGDVKRAVEFLTTKCGDLCGNGERISFDDSLAKVSIVGVGMRSHAGVALRMFELLAKEGINLIMISTSEIRISVVIEAKYV